MTVAPTTWARRSPAQVEKSRLLTPCKTGTALLASRTHSKAPPPPCCWPLRMMPPGLLGFQLPVSSGTMPVVWPPDSEEPEPPEPPEPPWRGGEVLTVEPEPEVVGGAVVAGETGPKDVGWVTDPPEVLTAAKSV